METRRSGVSAAAGASREEVASAVLVGLQPAGHTVIASLPAALEGFDGAGRKANQPRRPRSRSTSARVGTTGWSGGT
jgi:hypothetical protein